MFPILGVGSTAKFPFGMVCSFGSVRRIDEFATDVQGSDLDVGRFSDADFRVLGEVAVRVCDDVRRFDVGLTE